MMNMARFGLVLLMGMIGLAASPAVAHAQIMRPKAELTPNVETAAAAVQPGKVVQVALKVKLPPTVHVQSDKPRDPAFIPTVLTIDAPAGVTVGKIRYPAARDLKQEGSSTPLAVFGPEFTINVDLTLAKTATAGDLVVPAHLKYQACDEHVCYPPAKADAQWTLSVKP
jgi:DsbC/DsbD-like thiol-disulfide interchange protein